MSLSRFSEYIQYAISYSAPVSTTLDSAPVCRVLYRCELFDDGASYSKAETESRIESFLTAQLQECPTEAAALTIKTLNKNPEKIQTCVDTIKKIIQVGSESSVIAQRAS